MVFVPERVVLHPLVLLSVVDHYNRVAKETSKRVVGVLLGSARRGVIDVANSFAGVFEERGTFSIESVHSISNGSAV